MWFRLRSVASACVRGLLVSAAASGTALAAPSVQPSERVSRNVVVRSQPSTQSAPLDALDPGEQLDLVAEVPRWYEVRLPDGRTGFVSKTWTAVLDFDAADTLRVHFIDVDQGAATLLEFPCGAILVDAGGRGAAANAHLIDYLDSFFARRPDLGGRLAAVFITHAHFDHDSNLKKVSDRFRVGGFVYNGDSDVRLAALVQRAGAAQPPIPVVAVTDQQIRAWGATASATRSSIRLIVRPSIRRSGSWPAAGRRTPAGPWPSSRTPTTRASSSGWIMERPRS
jgi:beta-lactamase superfamily II metal-dependent hydrolase